jgi:transcriptional regulator with XRE-family HTH domain
MRIVNQNIRSSQMTKWRFLSGMTQDILSVKTGIAQPTLSKIERNLLRPTEKQIHLISETLGCSPDDIFPKK